MNSMYSVRGVSTSDETMKFHLDCLEDPLIVSFKLLMTLSMTAIASAVTGT